MRLACAGACRVRWRSSHGIAAVGRTTAMRDSQGVGVTVARRFASTTTPVCVQRSEHADQGDARTASPGKNFGIVSTKSNVEGRQIVKEIGVVSAGEFRSKNLLQDVHAAFLAVFGGETPAYSDLLDEASASSTYKLMREAQQLGATDVVNVRYQTTSTMNRLVFGMHVSVMGYGTAVVTEPIVGECEATYCAYRPSDTLQPPPGGR